MAQIGEMLAGIATLPLASEADFTADPRMIAAGESYLRRALEALLDLGRHLLAKGFGIAAPEYKAVPRKLGEAGVPSEEEVAKGLAMAGDRNRLVHFYDEVTTPELYGILSRKVADVSAVLEALRGWIAAHPERVDREL